MKGNLKNFFNSKLYLGFVCCCAFAAVVGVGMTVLDGNKAVPETPSASVADAQTETEPETAPVDVNKNAAPIVTAETEPETAAQAPDETAPAPEATAEAAPDEDPEAAAAMTDGNTPSFSWPVDGAIVLDYSTEAAIYDPTLDQYRTNDYVAIAAPEGYAVKASAAGKVTEIREDSIHGQTVVIDHQNGWTTTYSQMDVVVAEDETVSAGQTIGSVVAPTKYGVALGSHLEFSVTHDGNQVDPVVALGE